VSLHAHLTHIKTLVLRRGEACIHWKMENRQYFAKTKKKHEKTIKTKRNMGEYGKK
jgi:hypothetical protein